MSPVTRRAFFRVVGGSVVAGAGMAVLPRVAGASSLWSSLPAAGDGIQRIGRAYLRLRPREARAKVLRRKLAADGVTGVPRAQLAAAAARIADDYATGRVVRLDAWVLSVTEARLAALDLLTSTG